MIKTGRKISRYFSYLTVTGLLVTGGGIFTPKSPAKDFTVTLSVTVARGTCDIYGVNGAGQPIDVDMGDMIISNIDGMHYQKNIPYELACSDTTDNPALRIMFGGTGADFNNRVLATSNINLGLQLKVDNISADLNSWHNFNYASKPELSVIPVTGGNGETEDGPFTAAGTLRVEYQ